MILLRRRFSRLKTDTIFVAKHPVTKPDIAKMEESEKNLAEKIDEMVKKAIEEREVICVKPE